MIEQFLKRFPRAIRVVSSFGLLAIVASGLFIFSSTLYPLPQLLSPHDLGVFLDPGWRLLQGQLPHRDYVSYLGPVWALFTGIPIWLGGADFTSYVQYPAWVMTLFASAGLALTLGRLPAYAALWFAFCVGAVAGGTYHIGYPPELLTFSTQYNRLGFAIFMLAAVAAALPFNVKDHAEFWRGIVTGLLVAALLWLKLNFFMVAATVATGGFIFSWPRLRWHYLLGAGSGFLAGGVIGILVLRGNVLSYFRDISLILFSRMSVSLPSGITEILTANAVLLILALAVAVMLLVRRNSFAAFMLGMICLGTLLLTFSQSSGNAAGLPGVFSGLVAGVAWLRRSDTQNKSKLGFATLCLVLLAGMLVLIWPQIRSFIAWDRISRKISAEQGPPVPVPGAPLARLFVGQGIYARWGSMYAGGVEEALELTKKHHSGNDTVHFVDFTNPLNFGSFPSARRTYLSTDSRIYMSDRFHLPAQDVLGDIKYLLLPKYPNEPELVAPWLCYYGNQVQIEFDLLDQTQNFLLYKRKTP